MLRSIYKCHIQTLFVVAVFAGITSAVQAQAIHKIHATIGDPPNGPDSNFTVNLTMSPSDINIGGFGIRVGYDSTSVSLVSVFNNTGYSNSGVLYTLGTPRPLSGISYADTYRNVILSTTADLPSPVVNIAQLRFRTTSTYNDPENKFAMYLTGYGRFSPGGLVQGDPNRGEIPTEYNLLGVQTVRADFGNRPAGPESNFSVNLTMSPANTDISGFGFRVYYDSTSVTLLSAADNTGQPAAQALYTIGSQVADGSTPHVDVYATANMTTTQKLTTPTNLGQLQFKTTAGYNDPNNRFWLHLTDHNGAGLRNGTGSAIPTVYHSPDADPQLVPVTFSGFELE